MIRAASLLFSLLVTSIALFAANYSGELGLAGTMLGIFVIIGFAIIATGWTVDHDVSD